MLDARESVSLAPSLPCLACPQRCQHGALNDRFVEAVDRDNLLTTCRAESPSLLSFPSSCVKGRVSSKTHRNWQCYTYMDVGFQGRGGSFCLSSSCSCSRLCSCMSQRGWFDGHFSMPGRRYAVGLPSALRMLKTKMGKKVLHCV